MIVPLKKKIHTRVVTPPLSVAVGDWTETDPGSIKNSATVLGGSVAGWPGSSFLTVDLKSPAVASDLPSTGLRFTRASRAARGGLARASLTKDLLQVLFCALPSTALGTDRVVGVFLTNGTVGTGVGGTVGFGCGVISSGGACLAFVLTQQAGVWTRTAAGSVAAGAAGARIVGCDNTAGVLSRIFRVTPIDVSLNGLLAAAGNLVVGGPLNFADDLGTLGLYFGWTGAGTGTPGTQSGAAGELLGEISDLVALS